MNRLSRNQILILGLMFFALCLIFIVGGGFIFSSISQPKIPTIAVLQPLAISTNIPPSIIPLPTNTLPIRTGNWQSTFGTSQFDNSKTVTLNLLADNPVQGWLTTYTPWLGVRCQEHKLDVYVSVGMQINVELGMYQSATVRVRFDNEEAQSMVADEATDGQSLFFRNPSEMINFILNHDKMVFGFTPFNASAVVTTFDLVGLSSVIKPLEDACGLNATSFKPTPFPTPIPTATSYPIGSSIIIDKWQIKVNKIITVPSVSYNNMLEKAGGRFALVFMSVTNRDLSPKPFVAFEFVEIQDANGQKYDENSTASEYAQEQYKTDIEGAIINPDTTQNVVAAFDISNASAYYLLVPGLLSSVQKNIESLLLDVPK